MAVSLQGNQIVFNDATTQSTAAVSGVTSINGQTGAVTLNNIFGSATGSYGGSSYDITGFPTTVKRITLITQGFVVSPGTAAQRIQLGTASGVIASGYVGNSRRFSSSDAQATGLTTAARIGYDANYNLNGTVILHRSDYSPYFWKIESNHVNSGGGYHVMDHTFVNIGGDLTFLRLGHTGTTQTIAGNFQILWE